MNPTDIVTTAERAYVAAMDTCLHASRPTAAQDAAAERAYRVYADAKDARGLCLTVGCGVVTPQYAYCSQHGGPAMNPTDIVTLAEVAERAGVSRLTTRQWVKRYTTVPGPWKHGAFGDPHLYLWAEWEAWLLATGRLNRLPPSSQPSD